jgi:hypothetical protein
MGCKLSIDSYNNIPTKNNLLNVAREYKSYLSSNIEQRSHSYMLSQINIPSILYRVTHINYVYNIYNKPPIFSFLQESNLKNKNIKN